MSLVFNKSPLRIAATAFGRRSRPTADEDGRARLRDLGVALKKKEAFDKAPFVKYKPKTRIGRSAG
jgi:hypothetical protein